MDSPTNAFHILITTSIKKHKSIHNQISKHPNKTSTIVDMLIKPLLKTICFKKTQIKHTTPIHIFTIHTKFHVKHGKYSQNYPLLFFLALSK